MNKIFKILILAFVFLSGYNAMACTCIGKTTVKNGIKTSDVVVSGTVISKEIMTIPEEGLDERWWTYYAKYTIAVEDKYKGIVQDTLTVVSGTGKGSCGFKFEVGEKYIIYADFTTQYSMKELELGTNVCTRTRSYSEDENKKIRKYKRLLNKMPTQ